MSRKVVQLTVDVVFNGDHYDASGILSVSRAWIMGAFADRDDVVPISLEVRGTVTEAH